MTKFFFFSKVVQQIQANTILNKNLVSRKFLVNSILKLLRLNVKFRFIIFLLIIAYLFISFLNLNFFVVELDRFTVMYEITSA